MAETQNYTLGRGKVFFSRFKEGTKIPSGYRYIGNTPELNMTIESENLDHFSSDHGIREKDDSVPLEVTRTGSMIADDIKAENVALFFFGEKQTITTIASPDQSEVIEDVIAGHSYKLGRTTANPAGVSGIDSNGFNVAQDGASLVAAEADVTFSSTGPVDGDTIQIGDQVYTFRVTPADPFDVDINATPATQASNLAAAINAGAGSGTAYGAGTTAHPDVSAAAVSAVVTITAKVTGTAGNAIALVEDATNTVAESNTLTGGTGTSYIEGTDYTVDYNNGIVHLVDGGAIATGTDIEVFYGLRAATKDRVISGSVPVEGSMMYVSANPKGSDFVFLMPWIKVTPNGDYALKGDDWQQIPFNLEILKPEGSEAIYRDGVPVYN